MEVRADAPSLHVRTDGITDLAEACGVLRDAAKPVALAPGVKPDAVSSP